MKSEPFATARRIMRTDERQDDTEEIDIEKELWQGERIRLCSPLPQVIGHEFELGTQPAQDEHEHEKSTILGDRTPKTPYPHKGIDMSLTSHLSSE